MKITNFNRRVSGRAMPNRPLLFGMMAASIAALPALQATAQEANAKTPPTNTVVATPNVGGFPGVMVINAKDTFVYVMVTGGSGSSIAVIDTTSNAVTGNFSLGTNVQGLGLAVTPNGKELYAGIEVPGPTATFAVETIDISSGSVTNTIPVTGFPYLLSVSPNGKLVYVPVNTSPIGLATIDEPGFIDVINTKTQKVTNTIPVGGSATSVVFNPNGGLAYVTDFTNASVSVIDTATSKVTHTILVGGYDLYSTANAATDEIYTLAITNLATGLQGADGLTVIKGDKVIKSVAAPSGDVIGLPGVTPNGAYVYVPVIAVNGSTASFVYLMNTKTYQPLTPTITVGNRPEIVVVAHNGKSAYVANEADSTVSVIQISPAQ